MNSKIIDLQSKMNERNSLEVVVEKIQHPTADFGTIKTGKRHTTYSNKYFGFTLKVPGTWSTFGYHDMVALAEKHIRNLLIDDTMKKQVLEQMSRNLSLFRACPFPESMPCDEDNPTFTCAASNVIMNTNAKSKDFMQAAKDHILNTNYGIKYTIIEDIRPTIVGGIRFDMMEVCALYFGAKLYSRYFSTIRKGYELIFIASCMTEKGFEILDKTIKSVKFEV